MKYILLLCILLISACAAQMKGKPFVDIKSGKPYAVLTATDPQPKDLILWIDTIDGRRSRKDMLTGDEYYAGKETFIEPGLHTVLVDCRTGNLAGKYLQAELTFLFEASKTYSITCHPDSSITFLKFTISDQNGNDIKFDYKRHLE